MRTPIIGAATAALLALAACGGGSTGSAAQSADAASIARYQTLTADVQSAATAYGATMAGTGMTVQGCAAAHDAYDAQVRAWLSQLVQQGGSMDAYMDAHDGAAAADVACVASAMVQELDAHRLVACTFPTLAGDQTEAARDVAVMTSYASHLSDRCGQMASGQDAWGPPAPVCGGTTGGSTSPSDPLALGQRIFDTGVGTSGAPIPRTGGVGMMGTSGCAACHGYDGLGRTTMMFAAPDITYANLTDPAGMVAPDGTRGTTYTDDLILRAVTQGIDADGAALSSVMPHWQLSDEDWADLLLYLKSLPAAPATSGTGGTTGTGGTGGTPPPAGSGTISGTAFMGAMRSGTVAAYGVSGGMMGAPLGASAVDASGRFSIPVGGYAGTVLLRLTGGTFVDEATGATMAMQVGDVLTSGIPSVAAGATTAGIQLTPLTGMAQARAQAMAGGMTAANVAAANAAVGHYFGVDDVLATSPMDPSVAGSGAAATSGARDYGMTIAAMSQYAESIGMTVSSSGLFTAMMEDASDGVLNGMMGSTPVSMTGMGTTGGTGGMGGSGGMMGGGTGTTMPPTAGTTGLATAMTAFVGSPRNVSGFGTSDVQALVDALSASNGTLQ